MIDKTRFGIPFVDDRIGGVYRNRPILCVGRHGSGKTLAALHCLRQGIEHGEPTLLLSAWRAGDLAIVAERVLGFPMQDAITRGQATVLEYAGIMPSPEFEQNVTLPPASFVEFTGIVTSHGIRRVIIDTVLPWVAIRQKDRLAKHIYSFVQALERMNVTAVLTLPKPASPLALTLRSLLEEQVPVVFSLDCDAAGHHTFTVTKYLGEAALPSPFAFRVEHGRGLVGETGVPGVPAAPTPPPAPATPAAPRGPIRFASAFRSS